MAKPIQQAGAIPFRRSPFGVEVLLVSVGTGAGWGFPKGGIKRGSDPVATARAETLEEAGVLGTVLEPALGTYTFRKRGRPHQVELFGLEVERQLARWLEEGRRVRAWVSIAEAGQLLRRPQSAALLTQLRHRLLTAEAVRFQRRAA